MSKSLKWCFTLNNYTPQEVVDVKQWDSRYQVVGEEVGECLTPHLQGFAYFESQKSLKQLKVRLPRAHWEIAKGSVSENVAYCTKGGLFWELGDRPLSSSEKGLKGGAKSKDVWKEHWELAKAGQFFDLPPGQIKTWEYIYAKFGTVATDRSVLDNRWYCGPSGSGKSKTVRTEFGSAFYSKNLSKWWDGYAWEPVIVLEDVDPSHGSWLGYFLKIWADHYAFNAEVKCGMLRIRPLIVIVTSQYELHECFEDMKTVDALNRRFVSRPFVNDGDVENPVNTFRMPLDELISKYK